MKYRECSCTWLTGDCRPDCPWCGGEGIRPEVGNPMLTLRQTALLNSIKQQFPTGWFTSKQIKARLLELYELESLGILEATAGIKSNAKAFKLRRIITEL